MHGDEVRWRPTVLPWQVPFRTRCRPKNRAFLANEPRYILSCLTIISGILMASCVPQECWIVESDLYDEIFEARNTKTSKSQPQKLQDRACRIELADLGSKFPLFKSNKTQTIFLLFPWFFAWRVCDFRNAANFVQNLFYSWNTYAYLSLLMGCWNVQANLDSDLNWARDAHGPFCGGFPPFCILAPQDQTCQLFQCV